MRRRSPKRSGEQGARRQRTRRNAAPVRRQHSQDSEAASSAQSVSTIATNEVFDFKVRGGGPLGITFGQVRAKHCPVLGTHDSARSCCGQRETRSGGFELEIMSIDPDTPASLRPELRPGMRLVELQHRPLPTSSAQPQALARRFWRLCAQRC